MLTQYVLIVIPVLSLAGFALYGFDKRQARNQGRRVPESTLLTFDILGGWPGGLAAQRLFRHKTSKSAYQIRYWLAVCGNLVLIYLLFRWN